MDDRACRRRRAARRRVGATHLERGPLGRSSLPLRPGPDRHDDDGGRLHGLRRAGAERDGADHGVARRGGLGPRARAARAVLSPRRRATSTSGTRIWAEYFPAPRPVRTTIVTGFTVPGMLVEVEVTAGIPREGGGHRRRDRRALLRLLPAAARRRRHGRRPARVGCAHRVLVGQRRLDHAGAGGPATRARAHGLRAARTRPARTPPSTSARATSRASRRGCSASGRTATRATTTAELAALRGTRKALLRPRRRDGRRRHRVRALEARHGLRHREARRTHGRCCAASRGCGASASTFPTTCSARTRSTQLEPSLYDRVKAGFHLAEQWNVRADTFIDGLASEAARDRASRSSRGPR